MDTLGSCQASPSALGCDRVHTKGAPEMTSSRSRRMLTLVAALGVSFGSFAIAPSAHAADCDTATFTIGGNFDLNGYLACLSGTTTTPDTAAPKADIVLVVSGFTHSDPGTINRYGACQWVCNTFVN